MDSAVWKQQAFEEQAKINSRWLALHTKSVLALSLALLVLELCMIPMFPQLLQEGQFPAYLQRYVLFPSVANACILLANFIITRCAHLSFAAQCYCISFTCIAICFVTTTVHGAFYSIYAIYALPIFFSTVYGKYRLTTITAFIGIMAQLGNSLLINWDPDKGFTNVYAVDMLVAALCLLCVYIISIVSMMFHKQKQDIMISQGVQCRQFEQQALHDGLTQVKNKTALLQSFARIKLEQQTHAYTLTILDIDNFKQINDCFGHLCGDEVLRALGAILLQYDSGETAYRFGGDEFCILFCDKSLEAINQRIANIQSQFCAIHFSSADKNRCFFVHTSVGTATREGNMPPEELLERADRALYLNKQQTHSATAQYPYFTQ